MLEFISFFRGSKVTWSWGITKKKKKKSQKDIINHQSFFTSSVSGDKESSTAYKIILSLHNECGALF